MAETRDNGFNLHHQPITPMLPAVDHIEQIRMVEEVKVQESHIQGNQYSTEIYGPVEGGEGEHAQDRNGREN